MSDTPIEKTVFVFSSLSKFYDKPVDVEKIYGVKCDLCRKAVKPEQTKNCKLCHSVYCTKCATPNYICVAKRTSAVGQRYTVSNCCMKNVAFCYPADCLERPIK